MKRTAKTKTMRTTTANTMTTRTMAITMTTNKIINKGNKILAFENGQRPAREQ